MAILFTENVYRSLVVVGKCLLCSKVESLWKSFRHVHMVYFLAVLKLAEITVLSPCYFASC